MMKSSPQSAASSSGRIPLRMAWLLPMLLAVGVGVGGVGCLSWRAGRHMALRLAQQLNREVNNRIEETLQRYLRTPVQINHINRDAVRWGLLPNLLSLTAIDLLFLEDYFAQQL
ncbi:MAG: hypothetical protein Q6L68_15940, partial [Thermostichus sp. DG02_5_bins_236]